MATHPHHTAMPAPAFSRRSRTETGRWRQLDRSSVIAGGGGSLLLIGAFLPWYSQHIPGVNDWSPSGWHATDEGAAPSPVTFVVVLAVALVAIALPLKTLLPSFGVNVERLRLPDRLGRIVLVAGGVGIAATIAAIAMPPADLDLPYTTEDTITPTIGAWLSLAACIGILVAGWLQFRAEQSRGATTPRNDRVLERADSSKASAGWYVDPKHEATYRYWDGARWTDHTA